MGWVTRVVALAALVAAVAAPTAGAVVIRGTAYQFNATPVSNSDTRGTGARE